MNDVRLAMLKEAGVVVEREVVGAIYFIQAGETGPVKIGYSNDPFARLASLQTGHYEKLRLLGLATGTPQREKEVHEQFAHLRLEGEWFAAAPEILAMVEHSAEWIEGVLEALERVESLPGRIVGRVRLGDRMPAAMGIYGLIVAAKNALTAMGITPADGQVQLDAFFDLAEREIAARESAEAAA